MDLGLNIASAGMLAEQVQEDQISNDLANASTPGYKASSSVQQSFGSMLLAEHRDGAVDRLDRHRRRGQQGPDESQPGTDGDDRARARLCDLRHRVLCRENRQRESSTRATGSSASTARASWWTSTATMCCRRTGPRSRSARPARCRRRRSGCSTSNNPSQLGNNNFSGKAAGGRATGSVSSGELEGSGIDAIQAMVQMESALNAYTAGQQTIGTISQTMQESAQSVAQVP